MTSRRLLQTVIFGLLTLGLGACKLDPYDTGERGRWLDAGPPPDVLIPDVSLDACVAATEVCDGLDNDCNGIVDDASNLVSDVSNCGECGHECLFDYAVATCEASQCVMGDCFPGHHDVNQDPGDGCEYNCTNTNGGVEACDGRDNDCNGQADEGFDLTSDPNNCGSCRNTCVFLNGVGACVDSLCELGGCRGGFRDLDGSATNGCECQIQMSEDATGLASCVQGVDTCPPGEECADPDRDGESHCLPIPLDSCDGRDNDCDGVVDEDATVMLASDVCYSYPSGCTELTPGNFTCDGPCTTGILQCTGGSLRCVGQMGPAVETCNDVDDDCNGVVDDGVDKLTDPNNCGGCGLQCGPLLPNAIPSCVGGQCVIFVCLPGYWDLDPSEPGCEYACTVTNGGVEACGDGVDNDCNGQVDEGFNLQTDVSNCGTCGHSCEVQKPFGTQVSVPGCVTGSCRFECLPNYYDRNGDLPTLGEASNGCESYCVVTNPTELCDGEDNDCNGLVDEGFNLQTDSANCGACGRSCEAAKGANTVVTGCVAGACLFACDTGFVDLNGDLAFGSAGNGCECHVSAEVCGDGVDNDCNGVVDDENAGGCVVYYRDIDQDTFGNAADSKCLCAPNAAGRYTALGAGDCNDQNAAIKPGATEVCDGADNDCDGQTDADSLGVVLSRSCYTGPGGTIGVGPCHGGTQTCTGGLWSMTCVGEVTPQTEVCDGADNNCSGSIDETFDLTSNPLHCGACDYRCSDYIPNAVSTCQASTCVVVSCLPGFYDLNPMQAGCEYSCTPQNGGVKTCGSPVDNDCNGTVDASEFDVQNDPINCGDCGHNCEVYKPFGTQLLSPECVTGSCRFECLPNYYDRDGDLLTLGEAGNGCESYCVVTSPTELCDGEDNDCNGLVDEGFDLQTDPANCGACGRSCEALKGANTVVTGCSAGTCQFACAGPGFVDLNGDLAYGSAGNGCECVVSAEVCGDGVDNDCNGAVDEEGSGGCVVYYRDIDQDTFGNASDSKCLCAPNAAGRYTALGAGDCNDQNAAIKPGATEVCDGADNDCDGQTDADSLGVVLSRACYTGPGGTIGVGPCHGGTQTCTGGLWSLTCVGEVTPQTEVCDGADNNCSGSIDESFDLTSNLLHCGACNYRCADNIPNAVSTCQASTCVVVSCLPGFYDLDPMQAGCEYSCTPQNGGVKTCGSPVDNDCNGTVDASEFDVQNDPINCGDCGHNCEVYKPFGTQLLSPECVTGSCRFECLPDYYDRDGDLPTLGEASNGCESYCVVTSPTELCDGEDNDCNGLVDEGFFLQTDPANCGACGRSCEALKGANTVVTGCSAGTCQFACAGPGFVDLNGDLAYGSAGNGCECVVSPEVCGDGVDNDCNGVVDEEGSGGCVVYYRDIDQDTFGNAADSKCLCAANTAARYTALGAGDCNDQNASIKPGATEVCDGADNDCDGQTDANSLGVVLSRSCYTGPGGTIGVGPCHGGTQTCTGGLWSMTCVGEVTPQTEVCDGADNNCSGSIDETFDLTSNPLHCGACNYRCADNIPNAVSTCQASTCVVVSCLPGFYDLDPMQAGCEYSCTPQNGGVKTCGSPVDNDCNGTVDASEFDVQNDPINCGDCGHNCEVYKPFGTQLLSPECVTGSCRFECLPNYYDRDGDLPTLGEASNGCESYCVVTSPTELCDGEDNDCNGLVDEGFDLQTDPANCGACGRSCEALKGANTVVTGCSAGTCQFACVGPGFVDMNGDLVFGSAGNGCECVVSAEVCGDGVDNNCNGLVDEENSGGCVVYYRDADQDTFGSAADSKCLCAANPTARYTALGAGDCNDLNAAIKPGATEVCDGADNDCDGQTDADSLGVVLTRACYTGPGGTIGMGPCVGGTQTCTGGLWSLTCVGEVTPLVEVCDGADNNCSGSIDEGFDLASNPLHCGACDYRCADHVPNAVSTCQSSVCVVISCLPDFYDLDPMQPGCEYACTPQNGGVKTCGSPVDNDCNGTVDASEFDVQNDPINCGACGHYCEVYKPFGTQVSVPTCVTGSCQFECLPDFYDRDGDLPTLGESSNGCEDYCEVTSVTELCDGEDNNCNGLVDEGFLLQTDPINCGTCGRVCENLKPANSVAVGCVTGKCQFSCAVGYVDVNADLNLPGSNGCECHIEAEQCDGIDNDCNGIVDDPSATGCTTYYRDRDLDTYGVTGDTVCLCAPNPNQAYTAIQGGDCNDLNPAVNPAGTEVCDGRDNDCDGNIDNATAGSAAPLLSRSCYTGPSGTQGNAPCQTGTQYCDPGAGVWGAACVGQVTPVVELCDGVDNDCDGTPDDGFNLNTDMAHCGACNTPCVIANATAKCEGGLCLVDTCIPPWYNYDTDPTDCEYYCVIQGAPLCDGAGDRNCNGIVDGNEFDKQTDPFNCGTCGTVCAVLSPFGTEMDTSSGTGCTVGACVYRCATGFVNVDGLPLIAGSNGCECVTTNGGVEVCDNEDNDCNGLVDDGIDKDTDPLNCGACDRRCSDLGDATTLATYHVVFDGCVAGSCDFSCEAGYYDLNGDRNSGRPFGSLPGQSNGCEYHCEPANPGVDVCDGQDNDCDGYIDRTVAGLPLTQECYDGPPVTKDVGVCRGGVQTCVGAAYGACIGQVLPQGAPLCGATEDFNCNGTSDVLEFNLAIDPYNCGACGNNCYAQAPPNMIPDPAGACSASTCQFVCVSGYRDIAGGLTDGCEYPCPVNPPKPAGYETCNGLDDDCDGQTDEEPDLTNNKPLPLTHCSYPRSATPSGCDGVQVVCGNGPGGAYPRAWYCDWVASALAFNPANPPVIEYDPNRPNVVLSQESRCDDQDNDCDGFVDEPFVQKGQACDDGDLGACRGTGDYQCKVDFTGVECIISSPGTMAASEICDGLDNDCDGMTDENKAVPGADPSYVVEDVVEVVAATGIVYVYRYEASRPDATQADPGLMTHRSCSAPGVLPWANVSYAEAEAACAAAGFRLCGQGEWQTACEGGTGNTFEYPYLWMAGYTDYEPDVCNGNDYDYNCTGLDDDDVLPTGMVYTDCVTGPSDCISLDGILDMSGNLMEWTSTLASGKTDIYHVRGGSFLTHEWGLTCQASFVTLNQTFRYDDLGFRCCSSTAP